MDVYRILVLPGGAVSGIAQTQWMKNYERHFERKIIDDFQMLVCTSVGGIIGNSIATGRITAKELHRLTVDMMPEIFQTNFFRKISPWHGRYSKEPMKKAMSSSIGDFWMGDLKPKVINTAWCKNLSRTVLFKSWELKDSLRDYIFCADATSAAPIFFDSVNSPGEKRSYLDGGVGGFNYPIQMALYEIDDQMLNKKHEKVEIVVVGNGFSVPKTPYNKTRNDKNIQNGYDYFKPKAGGAAREEARFWQVKQGIVRARNEPRVNFIYCDMEISADKEAGKFGDMSLLGYWEKLGNSLFKNYIEKRGLE